MRLLITPDDIIRSKPSAARADGGDLLLVCQDVTTQIEAWAGRRFFEGKRQANVYPNGGRIANLPDPPLLTIVSVSFVENGGTPSALNLDDFGIEDAAAGTIWSAAGWYLKPENGSPRSALDREMAHGFPGGVAAEGSPHWWQVVYTSGTDAPPRAKLLARELASLYLDRVNRQGVTSETFNRVSRDFDFDKAEAAIRRKARAMTGKLALR